jgi:hypothetical protein
MNNTHCSLSYREYLDILICGGKMKEAQSTGWILTYKLQSWPWGVMHDFGWRYAGPRSAFDQ